MLKFISLLFLLHPSLTIASNIKIKFMKGEAFVNNSPLKRDSNLEYGDTIKTLKNALIILSLENYSSVKINEESVLKLIPPKKLKSGKTAKSVILKAGSVFVKAAHKVLKKDNSTFVLKTKFASMGVRGTEFFTSYADSASQSKKEDIWMCVNEGEVVVKNRGTKSKTLVKQGEGIQVPYGKNTTPPKPLAWTKKLNWSMNPNNDVENKVDIRQAYYDLLNVDYD